MNQSKTLIATDKPSINSYMILTEIVEFEPGNLPIKTIIRKTAEEEVSSVSFASDDVFSTKIFHEDIWIQVLDGKLTIKIDGTDHELKKGEKITVPSGIRKTFIHQGPFKLISVLIKN